eukprot:NODE_310_length_11257_cov_0.344417.p6 type:complete len:147 gc:universal NODE_310_length_11257_cov_0.344417:10368-10808(+)
MFEILITVGTTHFDPLIDFIINNLDLFKGYKLRMQVGSYSKDLSRLEIDWFKYTSDMEKYYQSCDYIITHGGSGTILNGLKYFKPILVIANDQLLGNHQTELIDKLTSLNLVHTCTLDNFYLNLAPLDKRPPRQKLFTDFIQKLIN